MRSRILGRGRTSALGLAAALVLGACSGEVGRDAPAPPVGTEVGQQAPELTGTLAAGEPFSLDEQRGAPVVVVFYQGAYCGLCREQLSRLQEHLGAYRSLGARVFAASADPPAASAELARQLGLEFPLVAVDSAALRKWGVIEPESGGARPASFVLGPEGVVAFQHLGRNAADRASDAALLTVLQGASRD